jgi:SAM-dependent methyltransferase
MLAFFPDVVGPLLEALAPKSIVEIGSESGKTTRRLVELARAVGAKVHAVDPAPLFDAEAWVRDAGGTLVMHRATSLEALPLIERMDAVLIDGDHNWYTVHSELWSIERLCRERGHDLPLVVLHDIAWPYGRRDLYYQPDAIPAEHRQPWAKRGIAPDRSELLEKGGFNAHLCNALHEGGAKSGVLTAVEDYLRETSEGFELVRIPAVFGLGILLPQALAVSRPEVAEQVRVWASPAVERFIDRLETARIAMLLGY